VVSYAGRTVLVTGGTGFIGGRLAERLAVEEGANVRVLVRDWRRAVWISRVKAELIQGDVRDAKVVARAMQDCQIVFHCVGVGGGPDYCKSINCEGTRNVLECAVNAGVDRFVYLSTCGVHGSTPPDLADEDAPFRPNGVPYTDSKIEAEEAVWEYWHTKRLPIVVIRPSPVWGPRSPAFTLWPVNHIKSGRWYLPDGGSGVCQAVYVDNLVDSLLIAGVKTEAVGQAFLLADDELPTWGQFFNRYAAMLGQTLKSVPVPTARKAIQRTARLDAMIDKMIELPKHEPAHTFLRVIRKSLSLAKCIPARYSVFSDGELIKYTYRGKMDTSKARRVLGHTARVSFAEGMRDTEIWLRDQNVI
jgi:nucleoside-diphosphate-sugar epimerase